MKFIWFVFLLVFSFEVMGQKTEKLELPKPGEVKRVEISNTSMVDWYEPAELLKLLPKFIAAEGTYGTKAVPFQYGKFILKNGIEISWMANSKSSILLYMGSKEQLYILPKKKATFPIWDKDGKDGFIDIDGNIIAKLVDDVEFSEGLAPVLVGDKWGYMNEKGEIVIAPRWKILRQGLLKPLGNFHEGLAAVIEEDYSETIDEATYSIFKCGYINTRGDYVVQPKFRQGCGDFSDGLAQITVDVSSDEYEKGKGWIGFIDRQGNWALKPQFFRATSFSEGFALVQTEALPKDLYIEIPGTDLVRNNDNRKSLYLIDKKGKKQEGVKDCRWRHTFYEGLAIVFDEAPQPFFINEQCEEVFRVPPGIQIEHIRYFEGFLVVEKEIGGKRMFGYLDRKGKVAIDFKFTEAGYFSDGLAGVRISEGDKDYKAYIDQKGEILLKETRDNKPFKNGLALQFLHLWTISERPNARNIYGYMNKQGKYVWLSPRAENYLSKEWIKENYIGPK